MNKLSLFKIENLTKHKLKDIENISNNLIYIGKPVHGNNFYWKCRNFIFTLKKKTKRCSRYLDLNHDFSRVSLVGVPKTSFDPKNNIIFIQMDNEEWAGLGSKMMLNISMNILFYLHISFWLYFIYYRLLVNNKLNVFKKWKEQN